jgi:tetratricopeptide (TPR) repeat protein
MNQQLLDAAAAKFEQASHLDPRLASAELNKGIALLYLQKTTEARQALLHASEMAPSDPHTWYALGLLYRGQSEPEPGVKAFEKVLTLDPASADSHYFLGSFALEQHDYDKAIAEYKEALRLNPLHASAEFGLARALQRKGAGDDARVALQRFQHLTEAKLAFPITHNYGEEGQLGRVEDAPSDARQVGPMIPIEFLKTAISSSTSTMPISGAAKLKKSCLIDMAGDGQLSLVVMAQGPSAIKVFRFLTSGSKEMQPVSEKETGLSVAGEGIACAAGDFDNDGLPDLAVATSDRVLLFRNLGKGRFEDATEAAGLKATNRPSDLIFVDYDHDGDLDLFVTGESSHGSSPNTLWRNNGDKTFTDWTQQSGLAGTNRTTSAMLSDLNNDRAVDLLVTGAGAAPTFFANPRDGAFLASSLYADQALPPTVGVAVLDFDKDGWMDIALIHAGAPGISLWRNVEGKRFERVLLPDLSATQAWGIASLDVDNDGWIDLAVGIQTNKGPAVKVLRNRGSRGFEDVSDELKLNGLQFQSPSGLLAADLSKDGATDLLVTQANNDPVWLENKGGEKNHSLRISFKGLADNKSGLGAKVEVFADGMWQKWEVTTPQEIVAGIGKADKADLVRLLWPTGVPQDEIDVADAKPRTLAELDRRGSSCPTLFAWNGSKFVFISDVIGAGVVGHWVGPKQRNIPDPDEWIKIEGSSLKPREGKLSLRFGEPMEEVNYIDQVRLVSVDHPAGTAAYPNEGFLSESPFANGAPIVTADAREVQGAWDDRGNDVRNLLSKRDHEYVKDFTNLSYAGFANQHTLTLDLGKWSAAQPLRLLLHGFVEYFSASSMYAAWQAGLTPVPPYVEAQLADGSWKRVIDDMGFPAGLPRTIVVDLTGKLPENTQRIRIVTNLQIYWDQVLVDNHSAEAKSLQTELPISSADLAFRGYPQQLDGKTPGDLTYNYQRISQTGPFVPQRGAYTHYGNVTPLLKKVDDEYVIFGTGEDMDLEFDSSALPRLPKGWVRDYFFYANGFVKDMDFYESVPFTVASMPFHGMSDYPYSTSEHYPSDAEHTAYQIEWNDRFETGTPSRSYRFDYVPPSQTGVSLRSE